MPSFDLHCRYALLTYAQCGELSADAVGEFLQGMGFSCVVGREDHQDGGVHLHCFVDFGRKRRFRRVDVFDVEGRHPNISPSKGTPAKGYDYAIKDGRIEYCSLDRPGPAEKSGTIEKWSRITSASDRESFWDLVHELDPKSAACCHTQLQKYCDWKFAVIPAKYEHPPGITFFGGDLDGRDDWLQQSGIGLGEPLLGICLSICVYGESRTGKTLWARSLGSHIYCVGLVSGTECMKATEADYAVFDDIRGGIKFFPSFKEWLGCQAYVTVKCLYREPSLVKWGKPSIWLSNTDPRDEMLNADIEWMNKNCIFVEVNSAIFHANT
ncbi:replication-associated protein [bromus associated gemycircularvirus 1]|uniref:Replication-associated protein n=1 Tax=bromus associated gemycircularvirus 1 TaxID=1985373 RepID=A0A0B4U839_9VIRU|nr:replication-associated protein [Bromus-associated circular DNA virus 3]AJC52529.1 replication-associated protein [Bromus-associated circular DNA virus 3]